LEIAEPGAFDLDGDNVRHPRAVRAGRRHRDA